MDKLVTGVMAAEVVNEITMGRGIMKTICTWKNCQNKTHVGPPTMALTLAGSVLIPSAEIICPKNETDLAWNTHFSALT